MFRNWIFGGLLILLAATLVSMILKSRKQERRQVQSVVTEVVKQSPPMPIRVFAPEDLEIVELKMERERSEGGRKGPITGDVRYQLTIRSHGTVVYANPELEFTHLDRSGKSLGKQRRRISATIPPGDVVTLGDLRIQALPAATTRSEVRILYAELAR